MKPERSRDQLKIAGIARARMFLKAHLDWMDGSPYAQSAGRVHWKTRPQVGQAAGATMTVDREVLRRSQAALNGLAKNFPKAMPKLVGDVTTWSASVAAILDRLKSAVHGAADVVSAAATPVESLADSQRKLVQRLSEQHPTLTPILHFVTWSGWYSPSSRRFLVPWIADNADWIPAHLQHAGSEQGTITVLAAGDLARTDGADFERLLQATLAQTECFPTVMSGRFEEIKRFAGGLRDWRDPRAMPPAVRPAEGITCGFRVVQFVRWLADQEPDTRRRATQLANLVLFAPLMNRWRDAWDRFHAAARKATRELCQLARHLQGAAFHSEVCRVSHELEDELGTDPPRYPIPDILSKVEYLAQQRSNRFVASLCDLLAAIAIDEEDGDSGNDGCALRLAILSEAHDSHPEPMQIRYFELTRQFLRSARGTSRMRPWEGLISSWSGHGSSWWSPRTTLFDEFPRLSDWGNYFDLLNRLSGEADYTYRWNDEIAWILAASGDVDQAHGRCLALFSDGLLEDCSKLQLQSAIELESDQFPLRELLELIGRNSKVEAAQLPVIVKLHKLFSDADWNFLIPSLLRAGHAAELARVAAQFQIMDSGAGLEIVRFPAAPAVPDWAAPLPETLHPVIAQYTTVFPNSRARIQRLLDKYFPDPDQLSAEIEVLQRLVSARGSHDRDRHEAPYVGNSRRVSVEVKQQRRLQNLTQRLNHPAPVSDASVQRLDQELKQALLLDVFRDTAARIESRLMASLGGRTGLRHFARRILPLRHLELVRGILALNEPYRSFALRLVRKEWGDIAWETALEPANHRFLEGLTSRGIRCEPWLASRLRQIPAEGEQPGFAQQRGQTPAGPRSTTPSPPQEGDQTRLLDKAEQPEFTLAFESNEVEKLLMGYYFGTCLSPDDCNFFSAVVNAIDINKRILYARDSKGDVVGRCLFAIGDAGSILVFRPYCHDAQFQFESHVAGFAQDLAHDMGTVISHTDQVSALLAPNWYNDGAYDLGNSITSENSPVRQTLSQATEENLLALLKEALSPLELTDSLLEIVIELPEFRERPQLIRPLLPLIQQSQTRLGAATLVAAACLAHHAGIEDLAARWLGKHAPDWIRRNMSHCRYGDALERLRILIEYHPSAALRVLRETRARGVTCDQDEWDTDRRELLAACFDRLGRTRLAAKLKTK